MPIDPTPPPGAAPAGRFASKHQAILAAAEQLFLLHGYLGTNIEELAAIARVSKPTVYTHFGSKENLFVELVSTMTNTAADQVHLPIDEPRSDRDVERYLRDYAMRQLETVLTPRLLQLRRLVIAEVGRFPDLAHALYVSGPQRAIASLGADFERLRERGLLHFDDTLVVATQFNWLVMGDPINQAMLLGDSAVPDTVALRRHAQTSVRLFLTAYGT